MFIEDTFKIHDFFSCSDDFPKPVIRKDPQSQIALKDGMLNLTCAAATSSNSQLTIEWKKDHVVWCCRGFPCKTDYSHAVITILQGFTFRENIVIVRMLHTVLIVCVCVRVCMCL